MTNLDEARMLAYLDGELEPGERARIEERLEESAASRETLESVRRQRSMVADAIDRLPVGEPDVEAARERIARRVAERSDAERSAGWSSRRGLAQAALLVLFLGGAAAAAIVPGSPLRGWLGGDDAEETTVAPETVGTADAEAGGADDVGLRARPVDGRIEIDLTDVPAGWEVVVQMVDDDHGAVYAPRATFSSGPGRIRMFAAGSAGASGGTIRVEIPRRAAAAVLRADGRVLMTKSGERLDFPGPTARVSGDTIRFGGDGG